MRTPTLALLPVLLLLAVPAASAQPTDSVERTVNADLQATLKRAVAGFEGDVGIYVRHLQSGRTAAIRADSSSPRPA
jgi:beta-lactamase class A